MDVRAAYHANPYPLLFTRGLRSSYPAVAKGEKSRTHAEDELRRASHPMDEPEKYVLADAEQTTEDG